MARWLCFGLSLSLLSAIFADDCIIKNSQGVETDLSDVNAQSFYAPDQPNTSNGLLYNWYINLCHKTMGICESASYNAYVQQSYYDSCDGNGFFNTLTSGEGGGGSNIEITYEGNPTQWGDGRKAIVIIECDPGGQKEVIEDCEVDTTYESAGSPYYLYEFRCKGNIACQQAPPPSPSPSPSGGGFPPFIIGTSPTPSLPTPDGPPPDGPPPDDEEGAGFDFGWLAIILGFVCIFTYVGVGIAFNMKKKGLRGLEAVPNIEFWKDFPYLVKDGAVYSFDKTKGAAMWTKEKVQNLRNK